MRSKCPWRLRKFSGQRCGFSLIEFTVVLALIGLLASIVTINVRHHLIQGKQNAARSEMATLREAVDAYYIANGRYPTNDEGLEILTKPIGRSGEAPLPRVPVDPWSHPYVYNQPGQTEPYEILCLGADGREGGAGADMDISTSDLKGNGGK